MCKQWTDFLQFVADMGLRPENKTLDRINTDGDYEPANCRWATKGEQNRNVKNNVYFTLNGETKIVPDWAEKYGMEINTLWYRINQGWDFEKALTTPVRKINWGRLKAAPFK